MLSRMGFLVLTNSSSPIFLDRPIPPPCVAAARRSRPGKVRSGRRQSARRPSPGCHGSTCTVSLPDELPDRYPHHGPPPAREHRKPCARLAVLPVPGRGANACAQGIARLAADGEVHSDNVNGESGRQRSRRGCSVRFAVENRSYGTQSRSLSRAGLKKMATGASGGFSQ